ncbi:esterase-like activity of phytase family protein [Thalassovita taeanensis]|uniref:Phytase-like domain-containing protein n=1 Tax=Thalassovita taeanensis TaxID=657014 RepID=A0A1H9DX18_9RHOB|nr:esterase-like activity of phytase family protein [Thalassovita taeanensis]SEQ17882.1 hypothetical protein SAMN04488092_104310 [Thalassovita taeanensis]
MRFRIAVALIALAALFYALSGTAEVPGKARFVGTYIWRSNDPNVGGLSALELLPNGTDFMAVSDRGMLIRGQLLRRDGNIVGVVNVTPTPLTPPEGTPVRAPHSDAEGLARHPDGRLFVSLEGPAQVWAYKAPGTAATLLPHHPDFNKMGSNSSLEALAIDAHGRLFAIPEKPLTRRDGVAVYVYAGAGWQRAFTLSRNSRFLPVGADFGPDGKLYLLERRFDGIGFSSRVRRFDLSSDTPDGGEVLLRSHLAQFDNLEGLSVRRDGQDQIRLTMVSDDNFKFFQRTELVEYVITEPLAKAASKQ